MFYNRYKSKLNCNKMSYFRGIYLWLLWRGLYAKAAPLKKILETSIIFKCCMLYLLKHSNVVDFVKRKIAR